MSELAYTLHQERIAQLEKENEALKDSLNKTATACAEAINQNEALAKDKERFDWLQSRHYLGAVIWKGQADLGWLVMGQTRTFATLREAIDAAMEGK